MGARRRLLAAASSGVLGALGALGPSPPTHAADEVASSAAPAALHVLDQAFAVTAGGRWTAAIAIEDPGDAVPAAASSGTMTPTGTAATVTTAVPSTSTPTPAAAAPAPAVEGRVIVVLGQRLDDHQSVAALFEGARPRPLAVRTVPLAEVLVATPEGDALALDLPVATVDSGGALPMRRPGLYPITIALEIDDEVVGRTATVVDRLPLQPSTDPPMGLALTAALDDPGPTASADELAGGRRELRQLVDYAATTSAPLSVAVPPDLAPVLEADDGLRDDVTAALAGAEVLSLPRPELDPSSAVAIDEMGTFGGNVRRGEDDLARLLPGVTAVRTAWIVEGAISEPAAAALRDPLGFRFLVLGGATYGGLEGSIGSYVDSSLAVEVDLPSAASLPAAVVHPAGQLLAVGAGAGATPVERAVQVLADLLVTRQQLGAERRRNVVLATDGFALPDPAAVRALTELARDVPDIELRHLADVIGTTDPMLVNDEVHAVALPASAGVDLHERHQRIALTRVAAESAGSMLPDATQTDTWLAELDGVLSTGYTDAEAGARLDRIAAEITAVLTSVEPPEPFTFTLTGRDSTVRLNLRNTADETRTVIVRAISARLSFPDNDLLVTLQPGVNEVTLAVEARTNGTSSVEVQVLTPVFGRPVGPSTFLEARVNALTGLGQLITGAAVVVLISWWYTHVRRRRRQRLAGGDGDATRPTLSPDAAEVVAGTDVADSGDTPVPAARPPVAPAATADPAGGADVNGDDGAARPSGPIAAGPAGSLPDS